MRRLQDSADEILDIFARKSSMLGLLSAVANMIARLGKDQPICSSDTARHSYPSAIPAKFTLSPWNDDGSVVVEDDLREGGEGCFFTLSKLGRGFFPRQKLLRVQVAFRSMESLPHGA